MVERIAIKKREQMREQMSPGWGSLTYDDVQRIQGSRDKVASILQERYGYTRLQAEQTIADFLNRMGAELGRGTSANLS
jgi:uncharacterized protein YjbJ (UPF0337 family)